MVEPPDSHLPDDVATPDPRANHLPSDEAADTLARWIASGVVTVLALGLLVQLPTSVLFWLSPPTLLFIPLIAGVLLFGIIFRIYRFFLALVRKAGTARQARND